MDDTRFGRYRLERRIGQGGMGDVWLARCEGMDRPVVVKRLLKFLADDRLAVDRFFDELQHARRLEHPNIVRVFDGGRIGETYFLAMESIDGLHLRDCLRANGGPLQPALAAALIAQAAQGLAYAHAAVDEDGRPMHLVHRDISPDNLMLDSAGTVKVVDFGIARSTRSLATTRIGVRQGKLRYMAPEYLEGAKATVCSDVYALGATLFELCTGQLPFEGCDDPVALIDALIQLGLPPAEEVRPDVPPQLSQLIGEATRRDPAQRPQDMGALLERLNEFLERYPPPGRPALARMVKLWMANRATPPAPAPSLGQLEPTAVAPATWDLRDLSPKTDPVPVVEVAHPLDLTAAVSLSEATAREAAQDEITRPVAVPARGSERRKVIVADEISGVIELPARKDQK